MKFVKRTLLKWILGPNAWVATNIPKSWIDKDEALRIIMFESLVRFVEDEDDLLSKGMNLDDYSEELRDGVVCSEEVTKRIWWRSELYNAYRYITEDREKMLGDLDWRICLSGVEKRDQETMETIVRLSGYMWT